MDTQQPSLLSGKAQLSHLIIIILLLLVNIACFRGKNEDFSSGANRDPLRKDVKLELSRIKCPGASIDLGEIELKITNPGNALIDQITLKITREKGVSATIVGGEEKEKGVFLINLPGEIQGHGASMEKKISIQLGHDIEAVFKVELWCQGAVQGKSLAVACKKSLSINRTTNTLIGDKTSAIELINYDATGASSLIGYVAELISDNQAAFQWMVDGKPSGGSVIKLGDLLKANHIDTKTPSTIQWMVNDAHGEAAAQVHINIKDNQGHIIDTRVVGWEKASELLECEIEFMKNKKDGKIYVDELYDDTEGYVRITNAGNIPVDIASLYIYIYNPQEAIFKVGNSQQGFDVILPSKEMWGDSQWMGDKNFILDIGECAFVNFKAVMEAGAGDIYGADVKVEVWRNKHDQLWQKEIAWTNSAKFSEIQAACFAIIQPYVEAVTQVKATLPFGSRLCEKYMEKIKDNSQLIREFQTRLLTYINGRKKIQNSLSSNAAGKTLTRNTLASKASKLPKHLRERLEVVSNCPDDIIIEELDDDIDKGLTLIDDRGRLYWDIANQQCKEGHLEDAKNTLKVLHDWREVAGKVTALLSDKEVKGIATSLWDYVKDIQDRVDTLNKRADHTTSIPEKVVKFDDAHEDITAKEEELGGENSEINTSTLDQEEEEKDANSEISTSTLDQEEEEDTNSEVSTTTSEQKAEYMVVEKEGEKEVDEVGKVI